MEILREQHQNVGVKAESNQELHLQVLEQRAGVNPALQVNIHRLIVTACS